MNDWGEQVWNFLHQEQLSRLKDGGCCSMFKAITYFFQNKSKRLFIVGHFSAVRIKIIRREINLSIRFENYTKNNRVFPQRQEEI